MADFKTLAIVNKKNETVNVLFDSEDLNIIENNKWHFSVTANGKIYVKNGKREFLHRLLLKAQKGQIVDHINGNTLDNRKKNLRITTSSGNNKNRKGYSKTGRKFFTFFDRNKHSRSYCVYIPTFKKKCFTIKKEAESYYLECLMLMEGGLTW